MCQRVDVLELRRRCQNTNTLDVSTCVLRLSGRVDVSELRRRSQRAFMSLYVAWLAHIYNMSI